ncbi:radical SAM enzyme, Cfr family [Jimgerdemannia flammicorona]|uniref:Radical SAM enzyme, Cfr family n=2 Tax=Jimgerdemannia flammicorona TaxID=994334 RepID=A0A433QRP8_9FUNG|nr:radical SAM enzyme, Cfr family [Jimgerdemannia flammicorona]RUS32474.1 radical SAM enzyme, Cfr family [Jimgerdemannia flammicorona]
MMLLSRCSTPWCFDSNRVLPRLFRLQLVISQCRFLATIRAEQHEAKPTPMALRKKNLLGMTLDEMRQEITSSLSGGHDVHHAQTFRANQIWRCIYRHGITSFSQMTNLPESLRNTLDDLYTIDYGHIKLDKLSKDGTRKFLVSFDDDPRAVVETVVIPEKHRGTLCLSSQIGCSLNCTFCHTGTQKLLRNLTAGEVVGQYMIAASAFGDFPIVDGKRRADGKKREVSNFVFMGQGEPLYNFKNVATAIRILTDPDGLSLPPTKITVSTSGVAPLIPKLATLGVSLAISLHAPRDDLRDTLVPLNKRFGIRKLIQSCREYVSAMTSNGKGKDATRVTFEYVMLKGVNDSEAEAREVVRVLSGVPSHVNLIPFNPWPDSGYKTSPPDQIARFAEVVVNSGVHCTIRRPRGRDIMAACGQLKSNTENKAFVAAAASRAS